MGAAVTSALAPSDPLIGTTIGGKYVVQSVLAVGGFGKIYRAEQLLLRRTIALKVLDPRYTSGDGDVEFQKRFLLEAATAAKLTHPNSVTIFDYGKIEGIGVEAYYMAMELVEGRTLAATIRAEGPLPAPRAVRVARQIARALREAHRLGIVHRDLKPSNVMLVSTDEGESVKVLDFGLVKVLRDDAENLTLEGKFLGSPRYMSPEQIRHADVDGRSDLYSLGVILYEMLAGKVPFECEQAVQTLMMHVSSPVPSIAERAGVAIAPELEAVVMRCLAKEPEDRFADVDALLQSLGSTIGHVIGAPQSVDDPSFDPLVHGSSSGSWQSSGVRTKVGSPAEASLASNARSGAMRGLERGVVEPAEPARTTASPEAAIAAPTVSMPARPGRSLAVAIIGASVLIAGLIAFFTTRAGPPPSPDGRAVAPAQAVGSAPVGASREAAPVEGPAPTAAEPPSPSAATTERGAVSAPATPASATIEAPSVAPPSPPASGRPNPTPRVRARSPRPVRAPRSAVAPTATPAPAPAPRPPPEALDIRLRR